MLKKNIALIFLLFNIVFLLNAASNNKINEIINRQISDLSKQVSSFVVNRKLNLSEFEKLIDNFSMLVKNRSNLKPYDKRDIIKKIDYFEILIREKIEKTSYKNTNNANKLLELIILFKTLLNNPDFLDKSFPTLCLDLVYHRPIEFVSKHKIGTSILLTIFALAGLGFEHLKKLDNDVKNIYDEGKPSSSFKLGQQGQVVGKVLNSQIFNDLNDGECDFSIYQEEDMTEPSTVESGQGDEITFPREKENEYNLRQPRLTMTLSFSEVVKAPNRKEDYGSFLRLFNE